MSFTIRASSTSTWPDCPRRGAARIIPHLVRAAGFDLRETLQTIGASVGTATHAAVAHTMAQKALSGTLANETETEQCGIESLSNSVGNSVRWDATSPDLNTAEKQVLRQYRTYRLNLAEKIQPRAVERRITVTTKNGNQLSGQPDIVDTGIRDTKTGVIHRVPLAQLGAYSLLTRSEGETVSTLVEDYIQRVPVGKEQPAPATFEYDVGLAERAAARVIAEIETCAANFERSGDPLEFMANPMSMLCSEKWCPAWGTGWCREHAGAK